VKLFVFDDVLCDYTEGMAVVVAESLEQAQDLVLKYFGMADSVKELLESGYNCGFSKPVGVYELPDGVEAGVMHYVYGGG
jgi:hypothetical protein